MHVENYGLTTAHNVCVASTRLELYPTSGHPQALADEVLEIDLALVDRSVFDLPSRAHRWVDIVYVDELEDCLALASK